MVLQEKLILLMGELGRAPQTWGGGINITFEGVENTLRKRSIIFNIPQQQKRQTKSASAKLKS